MVDLDALYKNVMDFCLKLRCENMFDNTLHITISEQFEALVEEWKTKESIPKYGFISFAFMLDRLSIESGSRFLSADDAIKVENAHITMQELYESLDGQPPCVPTID